MIMYYHENNNDYKLILMWFIDFSDDIHGSTDGEQDGDKNDTSYACDDPGKSFLILKKYQNWMTYEVNCSIYWYDFLYDFVMIHVCYIYCDILNYDVIMSHDTYSYISYQFSVHTFWDHLHDSSTYHTFNNIIHNSYWCKFQNVEISMMMYYLEHHDDDKFIVMWFLDIADDVHDVIYAMDDGDEKGILSVCDNSGEVYLMLKITKIGWHIR